MAEQKKQETANRINLSAVANDIRTAIVAIGPKVNTSLRSITDAYLRLVCPAMSLTGGSEFPRALRPHPLNHDFSTYRGYGDLICFHIGNAILAYYDAVRGQPAEHLLARVELLKEIAARLEEFQPYGSDQAGWCLLSKNAVAALEKQHAKQADHA